MSRTWLLLAGIGAFLAGCAQTSITPTRTQLPPAPAPVAHEQRTAPAPDSSLSLAPQTPTPVLTPTSREIQEQAPVPRGPTLQQPPLAPLEALAQGEGSFL